MRTWQLQDAKNRLSEVVDRALSEGPQSITRRGKPAVVVVEHGQWSKRERRALSVHDYLARCPKPGLSDAEVDRLFQRDRSPPRKIDLG